MAPFDKMEKVQDTPVEQEKITPVNEPEATRPVPQPPQQERLGPEYDPGCCTMGRSSLINEAMSSVRHAIETLRDRT